MSTLNPQAERILSEQLPRLMERVTEEIKKPDYITGTTDHGFGVSRFLGYGAEADGYIVDVRVTVDVLPIRPDPEPEA